MWFQDVFSEVFVTIKDIINGVLFYEPKTWPAEAYFGNPSYWPSIPKFVLYAFFCFLAFKVFAAFIPGFNSSIPLLSDFSVSTFNSVKNKRAKKRAEIETERVRNHLKDLYDHGADLD